MIHTQRLCRLKWEIYDININLREVLSIGKSINPDFILDNHNVEMVKNLIKYFNGHDFMASESVKGDLRKGILLMGEPGTGKTMLMNIFSKYNTIDDMYFIINNQKINMEFHIKPTITIVSEFERIGFEIIEKYARQKFICFDDLGIEQKEAIYYGTRINVMEQIIQRRYYNDVITLATTNYDMNILNEMYGAKVVSRIYQMFNIMVLKGPDRRKSNIKVI